ncbi:MAG: hypothetical protein IPK72_22015 [Candidatus Eisenbacteria bacterium]|nr:hypothetical protein [Candidatus Eisenbacteria bacterium]
MSYVAPTVTAHYVALAKPGSFRFESSVDSEGDPTIVSTKPVAPSPVIELNIDEHYLAEKESRWLERRQSGGIWQCSEQHSMVIVNKSAFS